MFDLMAPPEEAPEAKQKRQRKAYDVSDELHAALERRAAKLTLEYRRKVGYSEALKMILEEELSEEIAELAISEKPRRRRSK